MNVSIRWGEWWVVDSGKHKGEMERRRQHKCEEEKEAQAIGREKLASAIKVACDVKKTKD